MTAPQSTPDAGSPLPTGERKARTVGGGKDSPFYVPSVLHILGGLVHGHSKFWLNLGRLESQLLARDLGSVAVTGPIYVCGLARSGSTLLHEVVASHPGVATHRVKDYPMVFTPYWWRQATAGLRPKAPRERAHRDRVMVTSESPEALEEMLWMAFFPRCHDASASNRLEAEDSHPDFEAFYRSHIRKLLLVERARRYVAKANYHVGRLPYLLRLFPDAKIIIPVREPVSHIASLIRQHRWFSAGQRQHARALAFMRRSGHYEFGLDRRPMNLGDKERVQEILADWTGKNELRGWARYWDMVHGHLARVLASMASVRGSALVVRYEDLCSAPEETLRAVLRHCALPEEEPIVQRLAPGIRRPDYYDLPFLADEVALIRKETAGTASKFGY